MALIIAWTLEKFLFVALLLMMPGHKGLGHPHMEGNSEIKFFHI